MLALTCIAIAALLQLPIAWAFALASRKAAPRESGVLIQAPHGFDTDTPVIKIEHIATRGACAVIVEAFPPEIDPTDGMEPLTASPGSERVTSITSPWRPEDIHPVLLDAADWPRRTGVYARPNLVHTEILAHRVACGWPWPCFDGRIDWSPTIREFTSSGILTEPHFYASANRVGGYLCYHPRWPALIANTLVHGAILATLCFAGSFTFCTIRARVRRRRNLCPSCAYDLRHTAEGQPCPECGATSR